MLKQMLNNSYKIVFRMENISSVFKLNNVELFNLMQEDKTIQDILLYRLYLIKLLKPLPIQVCEELPTIAPINKIV